MSTADRATLRSAYLYLVCLVALVLAIFAAVSVVRSVSQIAYPDPGYHGIEAPVGEGGLTQEDLARQEERARESQRRQAVQSIVGSGAMLLISVPVYLYHWRRVQEEASPAHPALRAPAP